jgi:hypothetical protein
VSGIIRKRQETAAFFVYSGTGRFEVQEPVHRSVGDRDSTGYA